MQRLEGRTCLVTGAARGIGEAIVRAFHAEGAAVIVTDIDKQNGRAIAEDIGGQFHWLDVACEEAWDAVAKSVPRLDVLTNVLLGRLNHDHGVSMVLATHDLNLAASLCDSLVLVRFGRVLAHGPTHEVLTVAMIQQLYDVDADVQFHETSGHLTVVPIRRAT